jgi:2-aminoadipate transaminase
MRELAVEPDLLSWTERFASRARADVGSELAEILAIAARTDIISFAGGIPDPATFPGRELADILRELAEAGDVTAFQYGPTGGLPSTLEWLSDRLAEREGRRPGESELMVTSGGIEALELVGKAFLDPADVVAVEAPTYLGSIMAFRSWEAEVVAITADEDGLDPAALEAALREGLEPKLLYTIPDHQNPAGVTLAPERRPAVVDLARRHGFLVVEDVAYRDLTFEGERPPSLWSLAPDVVLQISTFSKTFMPGTRLGWACGPAEIVDKLVWAKQLTDQCPSGLGQRLLEEYGRRGLLERQIERASALYGTRGRAFLAALERHVGERGHWTHPRGGFFTWLTLPGADTTDLARRAAEAGVAVVPGAPFFPDVRGGESMRLSFSRATEDEIDAGVARLASLLG